MKKIITITLITLFISYSISGCHLNEKASQIQEEASEPQKDSSEQIVNTIDATKARVVSLDIFTHIGIREYEELENIQSIYREKVYLPLFTRESCGYTYYDNSIYYIKSEPGEKFWIVNIYQYDIVTGENNLIYNFTDENFIDENNIMKWMGDVRATKNHLYWVEYAEGNKWAIKELSIKDKELNTVREYQEDTEPFGALLITVSEEYVAWYEHIDSTIDSITGRVIVYSIDSKEIKVIDNNAYMDTPYDRIPINKDTITYSKRDDSAFSLYIYNLEKDIKNEFRLNKSTRFGRIIGMNDTTIGLNCLKTMHSKIYIYDYENNRIMVHSPDKAHGNYFTNIFQNYYFVSRGTVLYFIDIQNKYIVHLDDVPNNYSYFYTNIVTDNSLSILFKRYEATEDEIKAGYTDEGGDIEGYYIIRFDESN